MQRVLRLTLLHDLMLIMRLFAQSYEEIASLTGHTDVVNVVTGVTVNSSDAQRTVVMTGSVDSTVKIWSRCSSDGSFIHAVLVV